MRIVIQRVSKASVVVENKIVGEIARGLLVLLAIHREDTANAVAPFVSKIVQLRIFPDSEGKMNRSLLEIQGELLVISQFTLYADCTSGRRPSFTESALPEKALALYEDFIAECRKHVPFVHTGIFGAYMQVSLTNDGPVTCIIDSKS